MEIYDKSGNVIASSVPPESRNFDNMTIRNAWMVDLELEGMSFSRSDLSRWECTGSDLYGSILIETNMSQCKIQGVANLAGADFSGSKYDAATIFLEGFDPVQKGMIKLEDWEREHRPQAANS